MPVTERSRNQRWGRMASVRANYDVPAYRGREVIYSGLKHPMACRIISSTGSHLYLRDTNGRRIGPCHPTWAIDYRDGRGDRITDGVGGWELIGEGVKAPSRKAAIVESVKGEPEDQQYGEFATVRAGEFKQLTRRRKVEPTDVWE